MSTKILAAAVIAAASASLAFAQGTPPKPATNPAVGAGQRSTQNTPMGTTGTPGGAGATAQGSTAGSTAAMSAGSTGSMNAGTGVSASTSHGSTMSGGTHVAKRVKKSKRVKADRN